MIFFSVSQPRITRRFAGLELQWLEQPTAFMPWFFTLECNEQNEQELSRVTFDANLYDPKGVSAFMDRYCRLFSNASQYPDRSLGKLLAMSGIS